MSKTPRVPLYERLPEIYRTKDKELHDSPEQLKAYLALFEDAFGEIHANIEELYHNLFIETADDWVIPYIGDLLGTSHLSGDPWTLRADVADTIALRRRKGTIGAIELLAFNLTAWGSHCVELRENLVWNQHLNHQRPDEGGQPPYGLPTVLRGTPIRGGTINLRDPATLALLGTPFDPFAYTVDVKPAVIGNIRYNLPNLAVFLWRLEAYRLTVTKPLLNFSGPPRDAAATAPFVACFKFNPIDRPFLPTPYAPPGDETLKQPVRLFNTNFFGVISRSDQSSEGEDPVQSTLAATTPRVSLLDEVPGPIPTARLTEGDRDAAPEKYFSIETYDATSADLTGADPLNLSDAGLQLHLPVANFPDETWPEVVPPTPAWKIRGENLCAWEVGLRPPLADKEIAIDPVIGRVVIGVSSLARANALANNLLATFTYGAPGPVGAHPIARQPLPGKFDIPEASPNFRKVSLRQNPNGLRDALANLQNATTPVVIEIQDSFTHVLDLSAVTGTATEGGQRNLLLGSSLLIRAASNQRPVIRLMRPLRFRPAKVVATPPTDQVQQDALNAVMSELTVRLEGLFLERGENFENFPPGEDALIARAALNSVELIECTLDPGGFRQVDGNRAAIQASIRLHEPYGFTDPADEEVFDQTPEIILFRTIAGPLFLDEGYQLKISDSIVDAGQGVADINDQIAIGNATQPATGWAAPLSFNGITVLGRTRVESVTGSGGIFVHALQAHDVQRGCVRYSYLANEGTVAPAHPDRLPPQYACVRGKSTITSEEARLEFTSEFFGDPAYGQLALAADFRIRERGPNDDQMGAYGFLLEAHKWRNLQIRFREFMPVGSRPLLIPVT
jgi:hypothetical protein